MDASLPDCAANMTGKGRGIAAFSFHVESLGITRGSMPESRVGPNPLFPVSPVNPNLSALFCMLFSHDSVMEYVGSCYISSSFKLVSNCTGIHIQCTSYYEVLTFDEFNSMLVQFE